MKKFILLLSGGDFSRLSPAESEAAMQKYFDWSGKLREGGRYVGGDELAGDGKTISSSPDFVVSDGPFAESKEAVGGYWIILAADLEEAVMIAKGCPHLLFSGRVEVRPIIER